MKPQDFSTTILIQQNREDVFNAVNNVNDWWDKNIVGTTTKLNGTFIHQAGNIHTCKLKVVELIPGQKVAWLVMANYFNFTKNSHEWEGSRIQFDISKTNFKTQLRFTHFGLTPELECYDHCAEEWEHYIQQRLSKLISKAKTPARKEEAAKKK
jgi:hypothetical protein